MRCDCRMYELVIELFFKEPSLLKFSVALLSAELNENTDNSIILKLHKFLHILSSVNTQLENYRPDCPAA